jgi:hypothetical protein
MIKSIFLLRFRSIFIQLFEYFADELFHISFYCKHFNIRGRFKIVFHIKIKVNILFSPTTNAIMALTVANYLVQPFFPEEGAPEAAVSLIAAACICGLTWSD